MNELIQFLKSLSDHDKLPAIVIVLFFWIISKFISANDKKSNNVELKLEELKSEILHEIEGKNNAIMMQIESTKSCVVKIMYDIGINTDRRRRSVDVDNDRRR
jgi:hypothetical protein